MKTLSTILFLSLAILCNISNAQEFINYKKLKVPSVDAAGKIHDAAGNLLGTLATDGKITDPNGALVAYINAFNTTLDAKTEENLGKTDKDGNFSVVANKKLTSWKTAYPETGVEICLVRDYKTKDIIATVHKNYKQYGTSALYVLLPKKSEPAAATATTTETKTKTTKTTTKTKTKTKAKPKAKSSSKSKKKK